MQQTKCIEPEQTLKDKTLSDFMMSPEENEVLQDEGLRTTVS